MIQMNHARIRAMENKMKKIFLVLAVLAVLAVIAMPAFAKIIKQGAAKAYDQAPAASTLQPDVVVAGGKVIGVDPDQNIRYQLLRLWGVHM